MTSTITDSLPIHCPGVNVYSAHPNPLDKSIPMGKFVKRNQYKRSLSTTPSYNCATSKKRPVISIKFMLKQMVDNVSQETSFKSSDSMLKYWTHKKEISGSLPSTFNGIREFTEVTQDYIQGLIHLMKKSFLDFPSWKELTSATRIVSNLSQTVAPFTSLARYFEDVSNGVSSGENDMTYEGFRLKSFHNVTTAVSAIRLAKWGFFATGNGDETRCFSCGITHRNWQSTDSPAFIHKQISPTCRHVQKTDNRNTPISNQVEGESARTVLPASGDVCTNEQGTARRQLEVTSPPHLQKCTASASGAQHIPENEVDMSDQPSAVVDVCESYISDVCNLTPSLSDMPSAGNVLEFEKMTYPHYSEVRHRLESFKTWPKDHCKKAPELVFVGFFYAGYSDCVRCFVCGVGLRTWEEGDDPWVEHVRWMSSCDYVLKVRGQDFIRQTRTTLGRQLDEIKRNDLLETDACRKALEMGFYHESVFQAAQSLSATIDRTRLPLHTLLEQILALTDNTETVIAVANEEEAGSQTSVPRLSCPGNKQESDTKAKCDCGQKDKEAKETESLKEGNTEEECSENQSLQAAEEENRQIKELNLCKICLDEMASIVFLPCGHLVVCVTCSPALERCPVCRKHILGTVRVHLATMKSVKTR